MDVDFKSGLAYTACKYYFIDLYNNSQVLNTDMCECDLQNTTGTGNCPFPS